MDKLSFCFVPDVESLNFYTIQRDPEKENIQIFLYSSTASIKIVIHTDEWNNLKLLVYLQTKLISLKL